MLWGAKMFYYAKEPKEQRIHFKNLGSVFFVTFFLTCASPSTIILLMVLYPLLAGPVVNAHNVVLFSLGIFCGAYFWWLIVNVFCGISRSYITSNLMRRINQYSALGIICFACIAMFYAFYEVVFKDPKL